MPDNTPTPEELVKALLPCPFCGGEAHVSEETQQDDGCIMSGHIVWCGSCNCQTDLFSEQYDAIVSWNLRTTDAASLITSLTERIKTLEAEKLLGFIDSDAVKAYDGSALDRADQYIEQLESEKPVRCGECRYAHLRTQECTELNIVITEDFYCQYGRKKDENAKD